MGLTIGPDWGAPPNRYSFWPTAVMECRPLEDGDGAEASVLWTCLWGTKEEYQLPYQLERGARGLIGISATPWGLA